ncbi:hypothetical protein SNE40_010747 [Patella caerulea]|uniref:Uncharacterized protein n=1 Tax=Patella caerulea TaxID=87958 RepID=A0AAN8JSL2_PATCE
MAPPRLVVKVLAGTIGVGVLLMYAMTPSDSELKQKATEAGFSTTGSSSNKEFMRAIKKSAGMDPDEKKK